MTKIYHRICKRCGKSYSGRGRTYCSWLCRFNGKDYPKYWSGKKLSPNTIEKIRTARAKQTPPWLGKKRSVKNKKAVSKGVKRLWENPEYRRNMSEAHKHYTKEQIRNIMTRRIPNKAETSLNNILQENFPEEWKYVGDGKFVIDGKNPDFININGKKAIIELFGEFWHKPEEEQERKDVFSKYGYSTLIIWSEELNKKSNIIEKLKLFIDTLK